jgi:hypothetical protein
MEIHNSPRARYSQDELQFMRDNAFTRGFVYGCIVMGAAAIVLAVVATLITA